MKNLEDKLKLKSQISLAINTLNDFANNEDTIYLFGSHGYDWETINYNINIILNVIKQYNKIFNILSPIAKCEYWDYDNQTCTHTCRGCDDLNVNNPKTETGVLINNNRYCRLFENGKFDDDDEVEYVTELDTLLKYIEIRS